MLIFQNNTLEELYIHAEEEYPGECCGVLLGERKNGQRLAGSIVKMANSADEAHVREHFALDPLEIAKIEISAEQEQFEVVGFYHSHPDVDAYASDEDALHMIAGYSYPIISVKNGNCVNIRSFTKKRQNDIDAQEEILIREK